MSVIRACLGVLRQNSSRLLLEPESTLKSLSASAHSKTSRSYEFSPRQGPYKLRRTLKPRWFWPKKKAAPTPGLTADNREFLREVVRDTYEDVVVSSPLKEGPVAREPWTLLPVTKRAGVIGLKLGTMPQWTKDGKKFMVTLVQVIDNHVIRCRTPEETRRLESSNRRSRSQFGSVIVGAMSCDPTLLAKSYVNLFTEAGVPPKRKLAKFYISPNAALSPGTPIGVMHFRPGDFVDVYSRSIGRGMEGVMVRWGFKGGPATHGNTKWHRRRGSLSGGDASKVFPGTKMPGHMGNRPVNMRGLKIWKINTKYNVLYIHGTGIAGPAGAYVKVRDTTLVQHKEMLVDRPPPMPTWYRSDSELDTIPEELYDENLFDFKDESVAFEEEKS